MRARSPTSVACCAALLNMALPLMARAASNTLVLKDAEPQYAGHLCWAAADVLAVNQFYPHCPPPTNTPPVTHPFPTSQAVEAAYNYLSFSGSSNNSLGTYLTKCKGNIGNCNFWGTPALSGLIPPLPSPSSSGLDWDTVRQEIDAGRPFLFVWNYPSDGTPPGSPVGLHELVATGYSDERDSSHTQYLQIWDPWPVPQPPPTEVLACGPANGYEVSPDSSPHSQWILFSTYTDPFSDMGVTAVHADDQWHLIPLNAPQPPVLTVEQGAPPAFPFPPPFRELRNPPGTPLPQVSFAEALNAAMPQSRQLDLRVSGAASRSLGVPFPIVGLGFQQLLSAQRDPTVLLAGTTSAILFPVESQGKVVDAFLMLFIGGRWQRGGYANLGITQRLVEVRASYASDHHVSLDSLYMVSVPGEVAFFAAYGRGTRAVLIPASTDPTVAAVAGRPILADKQLRKLIQVIQRDLQTERRRRTVRLRP